MNMNMTVNNTKVSVIAEHFSDLPKYKSNTLFGLRHVSAELQDAYRILRENPKAVEMNSDMEPLFLFMDGLLSQFRLMQGNDRSLFPLNAKEIESVRTALPFSRFTFKRVIAAELCVHAPRTVVVCLRGLIFEVEEKKTGTNSYGWSTYDVCVSVKRKPDEKGRLIVTVNGDSDRDGETAVNAVTTAAALILFPGEFIRLTRMVLSGTSSDALLSRYGNCDETICHDDFDRLMNLLKNIRKDQLFEDVCLSIESEEQERNMRALVAGLRSRL